MAIKKKLTLELPDHIGSLIDILGDSNPQIDHGEERPEMKYGALPNQPTNVYGQPDEIQPIRSVLPTSQEDTRSIAPREWNIGDEGTNTANDLLQPQNIQPNVQKPRTVYDDLGDKLSHPVLRSEHEPSKMRKFAGALAGGVVGLGHGPEAGAKTAGSIVDHPYNEAYQDWLTETNALGTKANLDITRQKASTAGLSDYAAYINALRQSNPELLGEIAGAEESAREKAKEGGRVAADTRTSTREKELADLVTARNKDVANINQTGASSRTDKEIAAANKRALDSIHSAQGIAAAREAMRKQIADQSRDTRIPVNESAIAQIVAENEISRAFSNAKLFDKLFEENKDKTGYRLKRDTEVDPEYLHEYDQQKELIKRYKDKLLGTGFNTKPGTSGSGITIKKIGG